VRGRPMWSRVAIHSSVMVTSPRRRAAMRTFYRALLRHPRKSWTAQLQSRQSFPDDENRFAAVSPVQHMADRSGMLHSEFSCPFASQSDPPTWVVNEVVEKTCSDPATR
jgi:hypothetical protein